MLGEDAAIPWILVMDTAVIVLVSQQLFVMRLIVRRYEKAVNARRFEAVQGGAQQASLLRHARTEMGDVEEHLNVYRA
jgi:hypothetical protein